MTAIKGWAKSQAGAYHARIGGGYYIVRASTVLALRGKWCMDHEDDDTTTTHDSEEAAKAAAVAHAKMTYGTDEFGAVNLGDADSRGPIAGRYVG